LWKLYYDQFYNNRGYHQCSPIIAASSISGYDGADLHQHLYTALENTAVGEVLSCVREEDVESMYKLYLHDFVRFEHSCKHRDHTSEDREYQVMSLLLI
jgi:hypothetical protein